MLPGDADTASQGLTLLSAPSYWDLEQPAWNFCHPSEAEEVPLAGTAKLDGREQVPRKVTPPRLPQRRAA